MKRKFSVEEGDHISLVNVYNAFIEVRIFSLSQNKYEISFVANGTNQI